MAAPASGVAGGEPDREPRAAARAVGVGDRPGVALDDLLHEREAEADAALLRRDERLEQPPLGGRVDAGAGVLDVELDRAVDAAAADRNLAGRRRRVHRVLEQV